MSNENSWVTYDVKYKKSKDEKRFYSELPNIVVSETLQQTELPKIDDDIRTSVDQYLNHEIFISPSLASIQIESVLYAIRAFKEVFDQDGSSIKKRRRGFLIQDSMGTGKTRQCAAVILYDVRSSGKLFTSSQPSLTGANNSGYLYVWLSYSSSLITAAVEDMRNFNCVVIQYDTLIDDELEELRQQQEEEEEEEEKEEDEKKKKKLKEQLYKKFKVRNNETDLKNAIIKKKVDDSQGQEKPIFFFVPYKKKNTLEQDNILIKNNVILFGAYSDVEKEDSEWFKKKVTRIPRVFVFDECHRMKNVNDTKLAEYTKKLSESFPLSCTLFASATAIEDLDDLDYLKERFLEPYVKFNDIIKNKKSGNESLILQLVSIYLRAKGYSLSRTYSTDDVKYNTLIVPISCELYYQYRLIFDEIANKNDKDINVNNKDGKIWNSVYKTYDSLLPNLKVNHVCNHIITEVLPKNCKAGIVFYNTNASSSGDGVEEDSNSSGSFVNTSFNNAKILKIQNTVDFYLSVFTILKGVGVTELSTRTKYNKLSISSSSNLPVVTKREEEEEEVGYEFQYIPSNIPFRTGTGNNSNMFKNKVQKLFMNEQENKLKVLLLGSSASTGISLHQLVDKDRPRYMYITQILNNASDFIQMLGRMHRSGQKVAPNIYYVRMDIPGELHKQMMAEKKARRIAGSSNGDSSSSNTRKVFSSTNSLDQGVMSWAFEQMKVFVIEGDEEEEEKEEGGEKKTKKKKKDIIGKNLTKKEIAVSFRNAYMKSKDHILKEYQSCYHRVTKYSRLPILKFDTSTELTIEFIFNTLKKCFDVLFIEPSIKKKGYKDVDVAKFQQRLVILPIAYQHLLYNFFMELYEKESPTENKIQENRNICNSKLLESSTSKGKFNIHVDSEGNMLMSGPLMLTAPLKENDKWYRFCSNNKWFVGKSVSQEMTLDKKFIDNVFPNHRKIPFGLFNIIPSDNTTTTVSKIVPIFFLKRVENSNQIDIIKDNVQYILDAVKNGILDSIPKDKVKFLVKSKKKEMVIKVTSGGGGEEEEEEEEKVEKITNKKNAQLLAEYMKKNHHGLSGNYIFVTLFEMLEKGKYKPEHEKYLTQIFLIKLQGGGRVVTVIRDYGIVYDTYNNSVACVDATTFTCKKDSSVHF